MNDSVKSARRTLEILELLTRRETPLSFTELAHELSYPRSSLHGLLLTLTESGWLQLDTATRQYTLGIRTLEAGNAYTRSLGLVDRALPEMTRIRDALDETVQLAVLDGRHNVYIAKVDGGQALALASAVGRRLAAHATGIGKVLLAGLPDDELKRLLGGIDLERFTNNTITELSELLAHLSQVRQRGHGTDNEEYTAGVRCQAVPIRDHTQQTIAAMSVSVPTIRFNPQLRARALELLDAGARQVSRSLGHLSASNG